MDPAAGGGRRDRTLAGSSVSAVGSFGPIPDIAGRHGPIKTGDAPLTGGIGAGALRVLIKRTKAAVAAGISTAVT